MPEVRSNGYRFGARRGPSRDYTMDQYLDGQVWEFTPEEIAQTYKVRANSVVSAARSDAERMTEEQGEGKRTLKVRASTPEVKGKTINGHPAQRLILQAYWVDNEPQATEDGSNAGEGSGSGKAKAQPKS